MADYLTAPSYYLNQYLLVMKGARWKSPASIITGLAQDIASKTEFENYILEFSSTSPRGQWVNDSNFDDEVGI